MTPFFALLSRFRRDESGAFAMVFALVGVVLLAVAGAAVDFTAAQQARTKAQVALDAAALALQGTIYTDTASNIKLNAQKLLSNRLADAVTSWPDCTTTSPVNSGPCATVGTPVIDTTNGQLSLSAYIVVPMDFVTLVGIKTLREQLVSVATRKKLALEIAMVLDNSGSMSTNMTGGHTRMYNLQASANCATNILFYGVTTCAASTSGLTKNPNVKMAVVPFTSAVNVGTGNASASWIDRTGTGNISDTNFDNDDNETNTFSGPVDRIALFSQIGQSWGGCVEARINDGSTRQYDTDDTLPDTTKPDTLFTPYFAPDEPGPAATAGSGQNYNSDPYYNSYLPDSPSPACDQTVGCTWTEVKTGCSSYTNCSNSAGNSYAVGATSYHHPPATCTCPTTAPWLTDSGTSTYTGTGSSKVYTRIRTCNYTYSPTGLTTKEYQERLCKYTGTMAHSPDQGHLYGPNGDCPFNPITPLTDTPATITAAVNAMSPQGATNIAEGTAWGWRVLSPTAPFTEGDAYNTTTSKVMIVMTDGENTRYTADNINDAQYYSPYGFPVNPNRLGSATQSASTLQDRVDTRLSTICTNAKNAGIAVYTIGLATNATSDPSGNTTLLTNCASTAANAYFPTSASALQNAFVAIANQLAALRLSR